MDTTRSVLHRQGTSNSWWIAVCHHLLYLSSLCVYLNVAKKGRDTELKPNAKIPYMRYANVTDKNWQLINARASFHTCACVFAHVAKRIDPCQFEHKIGWQNPKFYIIFRGFPRKVGQTAFICYSVTSLDIEFFVRSSSLGTAREQTDMPTPRFELGWEIHL